MTYTFVIPGKPVAKGRPKFAKPGIKARVYTPDATRQWERGAKLIIKAAMRGKPLLEGAVKADFELYMPKPKRLKRKYPTTKPDATNTIKASEDAMNGIVFIDDAQITRITAFKEYSDDPRVVIHVSEVED